MANERVIHIGTELDTSGMYAGINRIRQMLGSIDVDSNLFKDINKDLDKITKLSLNVGTALKNGIPQKDMKSFIRDTDEISKLYSALPAKIRQISIETGNIHFPKDVANRLDEIDIEVEKLNADIKKTLGSDLRDSIRNAIPTNIISNKTLDNLLKGKDVVGAFEDELVKAQAAATKTEGALRDLIGTFRNSGQTNRAAFAGLLEESLNNGTLPTNKDSLIGFTDDLEKEQTKAINAINNYNEARERSIALEQSYAQVTQIVSNAQTQAAQKTQQANALHQEREDKINDTLQKNINAHKNTVAVIDEVSAKESAGMREVGESASKANTHLQHQDSLLKQIASRATSLIGIGAVFNYITRGIRDAWNGIKDLDKEFTQIAVVTDKTTSQLWSSYGTYSQMAQGLGVATKDAVATSALYYQQGLDTADVMTLTAETIKMAQIAGMDFATATNQMTAAIRGFNLEMNQASMVNDIFSTLAANAAVSTQELSYALTKTASIAESAGMSIDTTSAFLTKMIETTREAPENIGTAMKSIIARFEELKKNPLALTVEVDGEEVVANKVEAAIALAGVKLRDASEQFRDLDDVFLELAKSWDGLDRNTQRYIATIAAGSRQQSRFIALMDGYDRTLELTEIAQDSEGQSAAQFLKTLDSLDSKLNRVGNSLEQLYQKFVNSDFFGGLIDSLNDLLQKLGKLDAGTLAAMAVVGITLANTIIKTFGNTVKAWSNNGLSDLIGSKITKFKDSVEKPSLVNRINNRSIKKIENKTAEAKKNLTEEYEIKIKAKDNEIKNIQAELDKVDKTIDDINASHLEPIEKEQNLEAPKLQKEDLTKQLENSTKEMQALQSTQQAQIKKVEESGKAQISQVQKSLSVAMSTVGPAMMSALSVGITTAIATKDPWEALKTSMLTFATVIIPTLFTQIGTAIGNGARTATEIFTSIGGPWAIIITGIAAAISALIPVITAAVANIKTESQQLEETLDKLKERQQSLEENSEKLNAESSVSKIQYKHLNKLIDNYDKLINKAGRTTDENERLGQVIEDLGKDFPDLIDHYNEAGEAVLRQRYEWDKIVADQKESAKLAMNKAAGATLMTDLNSAQIANTNTKLSAAYSRERLGSISAAFDPSNLLRQGIQLSIAENKDKQLSDALKIVDFNNKNSVEELKKVILEANVNRYGSETGGNVLGAGEALWGRIGSTGYQIDKYLGTDLTFNSETSASGKIHGGIFDTLENKYGISPDDLVEKFLEVPATKLLETEEDLDKYINENIENKEIQQDLLKLDKNTKESLLTGFQNLYHDIEDQANSYNENYQSEETKKALRAAQEHLAEYFTSYIQSFEPETAENISDKGMERLSKSFAKSKVGNLKDLDTFLSGFSGANQVQSALKGFTDARGQNLIGNLKFENGKAKTADMSEEEYNALKEAYQNYLTSQQERMAETFTASIKDFKAKVDSGEFSQESYDTLMSDLGTRNESQLNSMLEDIKDSGNKDLYNEMKEQVDELFKSLENMTPSFQQLGRNYGVNIAQGLKDAGLGDEAANVFISAFDNIPIEKAQGLMQLTTAVTDWADIGQLKQLALEFTKVTGSVQGSIDKVLELQDTMLNPMTLQLDVGTATSDLAEVAKSLNEMRKGFKDLKGAMDEFNEAGRISGETVLELIENGRLQYLEYDKETQAITLSKNAMNDYYNTQIALAKLNIAQKKQSALEGIAELEVTRDNLIQKRKILQSGYEAEGKLTQEQYTQLQELNTNFSKDSLTIANILKENIVGVAGETFLQLEGAADFGFANLISKIKENGIKVADAMAKAVAGDASLIDISTTFNIDESKNRMESFLKGYKEKTKITTSGIPGEDAYTYEYDLEQIEAEIAAIDSEIAATEQAIKAKKAYYELLDKGESIIDSLTKSGLDKFLNDTASATKKAKKELEDYTSTLERYYTLQKQIEKVEKDRQKALKHWNKTGNEKDLNEYIELTQKTLEKKAQLAYVGEEDKKRILPEGKKKLAKYFTEKELESLQYDEETGLLDLDKFYQTRAYKSKSQNNEEGKEIDEILKSIASDTEKAQSWIDDYDTSKEEYIDELEEQKKKLEEILKAIDRLENIDRAMESIKENVEEAKEMNDEYYTTGGRDGINGLQRLRAQGEYIQSEDLNIAEREKYQKEILAELESKYSNFFDKEEADNKLYKKNIEAFANLATSTEGQKQQEEIENLIKKYNELTDAVNDSKKAQRDEARAMREFANSLKKTYSDLITRVADDMAKLDQKEIDEVKKKYAMIQEEDDKYLDALQKSIDKQRQLREQAKSYDDLEKDEKRLALLERDTSGANATEIAALKEQIKDKRQNLVDTEQDNIVNKISEENKNRKDKMDEETKFLQNVMDERTYDMQYYLDKARDIVDAAINGDAGAYQQMLKIMQEAEESYYKATKEAQDDWMQKEEADFKKSQDWVELVSKGYDAIAQGTINEITKISNKMSDGDDGASKFTQKIEELDKRIQVLDGNNPFQNVINNLQTAIDKAQTLYDQTKKDYQIEIPVIYKAQGDIPDGIDTSGDTTKPKGLSNSGGKFAVSRLDTASSRNIIIGYTDDESIAQDYLHLGGYGRYDLTSNLNIKKDSSKGGYSYFEEENLKTNKPGMSDDDYKRTGIVTTKPGMSDDDYKRTGIASDIVTSQDLDDRKTYYVTEDGYVYDSKPNIPCESIKGAYLKSKLKGNAFYKAFAKGGLVDFTGPAWVDGTKTDPEAFLTTEDTRNIQALTSILQNVLSPTTAPTPSDKSEVKAGDTNIEIHIDIEKIEDDYDVEQMLDTIESRISEASKGQVTIVN